MHVVERVNQLADLIVGVGDQVGRRRSFLEVAAAHGGHDVRQLDVGDVLRLLGEALQRCPDGPVQQTKNETRDDQHPGTGEQHQHKAGRGCPRSIFGLRSDRVHEVVAESGVLRRDDGAGTVDCGDVAHRHHAGGRVLSSRAELGVLGTSDAATPCGDVGDEVLGAVLVDQAAADVGLSELFANDLHRRVVDRASRGGSQLEQDGDLTHVIGSEALHEVVVGE